jgi:integrase
MTPRVHELLAARYEAAGCPVEGWIFPHPSRHGYFDGDAAKSRHNRALKESGVQAFAPYILRHTALTKLAAQGADAYTLARIAGHSSIQITMRYIHPQADAIERVFSNAYGSSVQSIVRKATDTVGTKLDTAPEAALLPRLSA